MNRLGLFQALTEIEELAVSTCGLMDPMEKWSEMAFLISPDRDGGIDFTSMALPFISDEAVWALLREVVPRAITECKAQGVIIGFSSFDQKRDQEVLLLVALSAEAQEMRRCEVLRSAGSPPQLGEWVTPVDALPRELVEKIQEALDRNAAVA